MTNIWKCRTGNAFFGSTKDTNWSTSFATSNNIVVRLQDVSSCQLPPRKHPCKTCGGFLNYRWHWKHSPKSINVDATTKYVFWSRKMKHFICSWFSPWPLRLTAAINKSILDMLLVHQTISYMQIFLYFWFMALINRKSQNIFCNQNNIQENWKHTISKALLASNILLHREIFKDRAVSRF